MVLAMSSKTFRQRSDETTHFGNHWKISWEIQYKRGNLNTFTSG